MNLIHPKKLLLSKWTAMRPLAKEKHFLVTQVFNAPIEESAGPKKTTLAVEAVELEAVISKRSQRIAWRDLQDPALWRQGWQ
ncbi:TIGR02450 family Trp-rich protein [Paucibacter sp. B2R-40]|uniref:TIGR02450 family Trp-rich protein n=1 Tax=Paucibacter sp. B2R-40 TaxID=2893554 RepID=UPI0021E48473|nr:TIGR02450 family Trp-rich protein [Paucibacter sp. B2R-40]MCV2356086.1 TIGR02450 family Trp-rich protein [Paucibacter sp. B2R-40]